MSTAMPLTYVVQFKLSCNADVVKDKNESFFDRHIVAKQRVGSPGLPDGMFSNPKSQFG
jgi:hypothetical protein